jgi:hypothetical protein
MSTCTGTRADGYPCTADASEGSEFCWRHDPARAEDRKRNASKGGQAGGRGRGGAAARIREVERLKEELNQVTRALMSGELSGRAGDVAVKAINSRLRAIELDKKLRDEEEERRKEESMGFLGDLLPPF